ncbi:GNAT family N-acetyltransferase [Falsirhodobacter halotolerans]|uniref:GNAT family N-acetyltransferase n=1 Tax=Falsirhodobacter halotolerans TaxID=1146892 RepID=UPI001FD1A358|nr:GNAT family N-acetyltransferase [Falsirhodobacter halotolerans]
MIGWAGPEDAEALIALYRHLVAEAAEADAATTRANLAALAQIPGSGVLVKRAGDRIVASVTLAVIPNLTRGGRPFGVIENVVTHADHRRQGHGAAVLRAAIDAAWAARCYKILLATGSTEVAAHRFYESMGFDRGKTAYRLRAPDHP